MSEMSEFIVYPSIPDTTPIGKVFKYSANGDLPRQFRIVQVADDEFEIHQTIYDPYLGLPKFIGGNGIVHYRYYWEHGYDYDRGRSVFTTYDGALSHLKQYLHNRREWLRKLDELGNKKKMFKVIYQLEER